MSSKPLKFAGYLLCSDCSKLMFAWLFGVLRHKGWRYQINTISRRGDFEFALRCGRNYGGICSIIGHSVK